MSKPAFPLNCTACGILVRWSWKSLKTITPEEYVACVNAKKKSSTWYPLTIDVFVSFLYKVFAYSIDLYFFSFSISLLTNMWISVERNLSSFGRCSTSLQEQHTSTGEDGNWCFQSYVICGGED